MSNFISDFLNKKLKEKNKEYINDFSVEKKMSIEKQDNTSKIYNNDENTIDIINTDTNNNPYENKLIKEKNKDIKQDNIENEIKNIWTYLENYNDNEKLKNIEKWTNKQLSWYLWNDFNLDKSIKKMSINEITKDLDNGESAITVVNKKNKKSSSTKIQINKSKNTKNVLWIFLEFLLWILFIWITVVYLNYNKSEYRFMESSINLWANTFNKLLSNVGWFIWKNAKENYINKKDTFISDLMTFEKRLKSCNKKENKEKLINRIEFLKQKLENIDLNEFISQFTNYKLDMDSIKASVADFCK